MEENKRIFGWKFYLAEFGILVLGALGMWLFGSIILNNETLNSVKKLTADRLLGDCVMTVLGLAMTCFHLRMEYTNGKLDYNNGKHLFRFLFCLCIGLVVGFVCGFLPVGGWPFFLCLSCCLYTAI